MTGLNFRGRLLSGAALAVLGSLAIVGAHEPAKADSICTADMATAPNAFTCVDPAASAQGTGTQADTSPIATGTFSEGAMLHSSLDGGLIISSSSGLDVVLDGQITTSGEREYGVYLNSLSGSGGAISYVSNGTVSTAGSQTNTALTGTSVSASTANVLASGVHTIGVWSHATNGNSNVTGGFTTVGPLSWGIATHATNGDNVTNSGVIDASAENSLGLAAVTIAGTSCGTNTVNVTGDITSYGYGIYARSCGAGVINVNAGVSMTRTDDWFSSILNWSQTEATTTISGNVSAYSAGHFVLQIYGTSSITVLNGSATLTGLITADEGDDLFTLHPGATWNTANASGFRGGIDVLTNAGTIRAVNGLASFDDLDTFANSGSIDLQDGGANDVLITWNDYVGDGGRLLVDAAGTSADQFVIGGAASGTTFLLVNGDQVIDTDGVLVVDAGTATDKAFVLANTSATRLIDYRLEQEGGDFFLFAAPNANAFLPLGVGNVSQDMWHQAADVTFGNLAQRSAGMSNRRHGSGFWGQFFANHDRYGDRETRTVFGSDIEVDSRLPTDRRGAQAGIDFMARSGEFALGLTGGYQQAAADQGSPGEIDAKGYNIGAYAHAGGMTGAYGRLLIKHDRNAVRLRNGGFDLSSGDPDARSTGAKGEAGYRWASSSLNLEAAAGVAWVRTSIDDFSAEGIDYDFSSGTSVRGHVGGRVGFSGKLAPFIDAKLFHEFDGDTKLTMRSDDERDSLRSQGRGTWGRIEAGLGGTRAPSPFLAAWAEVGDTRGLGLCAGFRF